MSQTAVAPTENPAAERTILFETLDSSGHKEEELPIGTAAERFEEARRRGAGLFASAGDRQLGNVREIPPEADRVTVVSPMAGG